MLRNPAFGMTAVGVISMGIGATTAGETVGVDDARVRGIAGSNGPLRIRRHGESVGGQSHQRRGHGGGRRGVSERQPPSSRWPSRSAVPSSSGCWPHGRRRVVMPGMRCAARRKLQGAPAPRGWAWAPGRLPCRWFCLLPPDYWPDVHQLPERHPRFQFLLAYSRCRSSCQSACSTTSKNGGGHWRDRPESAL